MTHGEHVVHLMMTLPTGVPVPEAFLTENGAKLSKNYWVKYGPRPGKARYIHVIRRVMRCRLTQQTRV